MPHVWDVKAKGCQSKGMSQPMGCQGKGLSKQYRGSQSGNFGGETNERIGDRTAPDETNGGRIMKRRIMKRMMSWTPTPSHLMKQMPRKRGLRHKGLESTKWNDEISYLGPEKLMSFWAIFLVLHFASLICGNPLFGCYRGGTSEYIYIYMGKKFQTTSQDMGYQMDGSPIHVFLTRPLSYIHYTIDSSH